MVTMIYKLTVENDPSPTIFPNLKSSAVGLREFRELLPGLLHVELGRLPDGVWESPVSALDELITRNSQQFSLCGMED